MNNIKTISVSSCKIDLHLNYLKRIVGLRPENITSFIDRQRQFWEVYFDGESLAFMNSGKEILLTASKKDFECIARENFIR